VAAALSSTDFAILEGSSSQKALPKNGHQRSSLHEFLMNSGSLARFDLHANTLDLIKIFKAQLTSKKFRKRNPIIDKIINNIYENRALITFEDFILIMKNTPPEKLETTSTKTLICDMLRHYLPYLNNEDNETLRDLIVNKAPLKDNPIIDTITNNMFENRASITFEIFVFVMKNYSLEKLETPPIKSLISDMLSYHLQTLKGNTVLIKLIEAFPHLIQSNAKDYPLESLKTIDLTNTRCSIYGLKKILKVIPFGSKITLKINPEIYKEYGNVIKSDFSYEFDSKVGNVIFEKDGEKIAEYNSQTKQLIYDK
jgi:hypothetical protein